MRVAKRSVCGIFAVDYGSYGRGNSRKAESSAAAPGGGKGGMGGMGAWAAWAAWAALNQPLAPCGTIKTGVTPGFLCFKITKISDISIHQKQLVYFVL